MSFLLPQWLMSQQRARKTHFMNTCENTVSNCCQIEGYHSTYPIHRLRNSGFEDISFAAGKQDCSGRNTKFEVGLPLVRRTTSLAGYPDVEVTSLCTFSAFFALLKNHVPDGQSLDTPGFGRPAKEVEHASTKE